MARQAAALKSSKRRAEGACTPAQPRVRRECRYNTNKL